MRQLVLFAASALLLAGCESEQKFDPRAAQTGQVLSLPAQSSAVPKGAAAGDAWNLQRMSEGVALIKSNSGAIRLRMLCTPGSGELLVNVPAFEPIGSEERLSFGSDGNVMALVADVADDQQRGGVSATRAVPENLAALIGGPISASYGRQSSGPHAVPDPELASQFVAACQDAAGPGDAKRNEEKVSACMMQDGRRLRNPMLHVVGAEPFWAAKVEGRCVTYSHPENQAGTRVWTQYTPSPSGGGRWSGALDNREFQLIVEPQQGCSDGMSDTEYPLAAQVKVKGEERRGCAELR